MVWFVRCYQSLTHYLPMVGCVLFILGTETALGGGNSILNTTTFVKPSFKNPYYSSGSQTWSSATMCRSASSNPTAANPLQISQNTDGTGTNFQASIAGFYEVQFLYTWSVGAGASYPSTLWTDAWIEAKDALGATVFNQLFYSGDVPYQIYSPDTSVQFVMNAHVYLKLGDRVYFPRVWTTDNTTNSWCVAVTLTMKAMRASSNPAN